MSDSSARSYSRHRVRFGASIAFTGASRDSIWRTKALGEDRESPPKADTATYPAFEYRVEYTDLDFSAGIFHATFTWKKHDENIESFPPQKEIQIGEPGCVVKKNSSNGSTPLPKTTPLASGLR